MESQSVLMPSEFSCFISDKLQKNGEGGRPHFLQVLARDHNVQNEVLDIVELVWLKNRSLGSIAKKYETSYHTIYRLLQDLEPFKEELVHVLRTVPRRKVFWNRQTSTSDYETVTAYIKHAQRAELKTWKGTLKNAEKVWRALGYRDPTKWTADEVVDFLRTKSEKGQSNYLDAIRSVAPQIADKNSSDYVGTGIYREKVSRRKILLFGAEIKLIHEALDAKGMEYHKTIFDLHITGGFREGSKKPTADSKLPESGICGISWDRFHKNFQFVDDFESKVRKRGIWWRDCPVDLFFHDLPDRLRKMWIERGKPTVDKVILDDYQGLLRLYKEIRKALKEYWQGKLDPDILLEFSKLKPHMADKIHCNMLWEAEVPLEVVAGQYIGGSEGVGLVGRGWLSIDTIKKYYLSLTRRSPRFKKILKQVDAFAMQFNGRVPD